MMLFEHIPDDVQLLFVHRNQHPRLASSTAGWDTRHGYRFGWLDNLFRTGSHNPQYGAWYAKRTAVGWDVSPAERAAVAEAITAILAATLTLQGARVAWTSAGSFDPPVGTMGLAIPDYVIAAQFADDTYRVIDVGGVRDDGKRYAMLWDDVAGKAFTQVNPDEPAQTFTGHEHHPVGAFQLGRASRDALLAALGMVGDAS